jgi:hypothetical protein
MRLHRIKFWGNLHERVRCWVQRANIQTNQSLAIVILYILRLLHKTSNIKNLVWEVDFTKEQSVFLYSFSYKCNRISLVTIFGHD